MIWPQGGAYMGLNVHVKCKYMCNRDNLVIKGSHVKLWIVLYKRSCNHYWGNGEDKRYLVIWSGLPYSLRSYCVTYLYWSFSPCWRYAYQAILLIAHLYDKLRFIRCEKSMLPKSENSSLCKNIAVSLFTKRNKN